MTIVKRQKGYRKAGFPYSLLSKKVAILLWATINFPSEVEVEIRLPIEFLLTIENRENAFIALRAGLFVRRDWGQIFYLHIPYWIEFCALAFLRGV
jgi:hypothetical protein